jgi:hypothetical protein
MVASCVPKTRRSRYNPRVNVWSIGGTVAASVLASVGGVSVLFRYFGDFLLERTKARWNRELETFKDKLNTEQRRYQAQLDRSIFISRAHFDTEFQAIKEVHQCLSEVKIPFRKLFPINAATIVTGAEPAEWIMRLEDANNRFLTKLEEWGVFLEPAQYDEFKRCHDAAEHFMEIYPLRGPEMERDYVVTRNHFWDSYREACQKARDRIGKLAVLPQG